MKARLAVVALAVCFAQSWPVVGQTAIADPIELEIEAMERKFFEHDFSKEALTYRVARLEKFAFGQPAIGPIDKRINRLADVIDLHKALVPPVVSPNASAASSSAPAIFNPSDLDPAMRAKYPHITTLEHRILGETFEMDSLSERLARLEIKAFGKASNSPDPAARTDELEGYVQRKLFHRAYNVDSESVVSQGSSYEEGTQRTSVPAPVQVAADPAVISETPPDAHARMLTRVAWCEQHLFGHTFPNLHLTQRLHQLNTKLFPQKHDEPDFVLMDRLDIIVREVVMSQHPPLVSSKQQ